METNLTTATILQPYEREARQSHPSCGNEIDAWNTECGSYQEWIEPPLLDGYLCISSTNVPMLEMRVSHSQLPCRAYCILLKNDRCVDFKMATQIRFVLENPREIATLLNSCPNTCRSPVRTLPDSRQVNPKLHAPRECDFDVIRQMSNALPFCSTVILVPRPILLSANLSNAIPEINSSRLGEISSAWPRETCDLCWEVQCHLHIACCDAPA